MLRLTLVASGAQFKVGDGPDPLTIGRAATSRLVIDDPHVSALHGQIMLSGGQYLFQDLKSTNGSAVERSGRRQVVDGTNPAGFALLPGDRILLGSETEPVILEVTAIEQPLAATAPTGATVVATRRMATAKEVSGRIESSGRTLVPFLALAERLSEAGNQDESFAALAGFLASLFPAITESWVLDASSKPPVVLFSRDAGGGGPSAAPPADADQIAVLETGEGKTLAWIPVDPATAVWIGVVTGIGGLPPTELDSLSLCATLLGARLRQLRLVAQLESARAQLSAKNRYLRERAEQSADVTMVGQSAALAELRRQIQAVALSDATVLITGPSGSGKELVAREIHRQSLRHNEIFAAINCGALVETLLECELFGCKKGAFTGAVKDRDGLFEVAHGGTLFLDEIGEMSSALQIKLLRVLETGEVVPVGANRMRRVNVRVLAATNRDLPKEVELGRFREDLFYRIHVFPIRVPALAERREDIPLLVRHFARKFAESSGCAECQVSAEALRVLCARDFPGNIRQLANEVHRAVLLASGGGRLEPAHLLSQEEAGLARAAREAGGGSLKEQLARVERALIQEVLEKHQGNRTYTARELGITRQALLLKLNRHGL